MFGTQVDLISEEETLKVIGVIGCGGKLGQEICQLLLRNFKVKGGQRHEPKALIELENFTWEHLDIYDKKSLDSFCNGCDLIINCAGPAYIVSRAIAEAAASAGIIYTDVSDALISDKEFNKNAGNGEFIVGLGYYPGIVGMLLNNLSTHFDRIDRIYGISGGNEAFTAISCIDIALSGESGAAVSDCYWENGSFHKTNEKLKYDYFEPVGRSVYKKRFISNEIATLLPRLNVGKLEWFDITESNTVGVAAMKYYSLRDKYEIDEIIRRLSESISKSGKDSEGDEWNILDITANGQKDGEDLTVHIELRLGGTYKITAFAVAETVARVFENKRKQGMIWANEMIPFSAVEDYKKFDEDFVFSYEEEFEI